MYSYNPSFFFRFQFIAEDLSEHTNNRHNGPQPAFGGSFDKKDQDSMFMLMEGTGTSSTPAHNRRGVNLGPFNRTITYRNVHGLDPTDAVWVRLRRVFGIWIPVAPVTPFSVTDYSLKYLAIVAAGIPSLQPVTLPGPTRKRPHSVIQWIDLLAPGGISKILVHCLFVSYKYCNTNIYLQLFLLSPSFIFAGV
jgi:hypothetical protein